MESVLEQGAEEWTVQKITSLPAGKNEIAVEEPAILEQLAERSLVKWKWDGETRLEDFLVSKVKLEWSGADGTAHQVMAAWPRCLRVRYDPRRRDDAPGFRSWQG